MSIEKQSNSAVANSKYKRIIQILWVLVLAPIIGVTTLVFGIALFADLPDIEELTNPESNLATVAYSSDGKELGRFYLENRVTTHYKDIDLDVIHALVATEDERYYEHSGVDGGSQETYCNHRRGYYYHNHISIYTCYFPYYNWIYCSENIYQ